MFWHKKKEEPKGLLLYTNVQDVIATHSVLQKEGLAVALVPPPPEVAVGCDLAIQFNPVEEEIIRGLAARRLIFPGEIHFVACPQTAVKNLTRLTEIAPGYLMAASNNIKVTVDLENHEIVNISGGGCPDIPYVAHRLIGSRLEDCPEPVEVGTTLCSYMVQLAVDRLRQEVKKC